MKKRHVGISQFLIYEQNSGRREEDGKDRALHTAFSHECHPPTQCTLARTFGVFLSLRLTGVKKHPTRGNIAHLAHTAFTKIYLSH